MQRPSHGFGEARVFYYWRNQAGRTGKGARTDSVGIKIILNDSYIVAG